MLRPDPECGRGDRPVAPTFYKRMQRSAFLQREDYASKYPVSRDQPRASSPSHPSLRYSNTPLSYPHPAFLIPHACSSLSSLILPLMSIPLGQWAKQDSQELQGSAGAYEAISRKSPRARPLCLYPVWYMYDLMYSGMSRRRRQLPTHCPHPWQ